jgi:transcriptional regulator with PAS, ATPase and Fis domain
MEIQPWFKELPISICVSDADGTILELNDLARQTYAPEGKEIIQTNMLDCHPEPARTKLVEMMQNEITNIYTIEKNGKKSIIIHVPWYSQGKYQGHVELSLAIPDQMPHFVREPKK